MKSVSATAATAAVLWCLLGLSVQYPWVHDNVLSHGVSGFIYKPIFADLNAIVRASHATDQGIDVLRAPGLTEVTNPDIIFNYPRPWLFLGWLGRHVLPSNLLALLIDGAFLAVLAHLFSGRTLIDSVVGVLAVVSLPVCLVLERCNNDIVVWLLLATACALLATRSWTWRTAAGLGLLLGAAMLKLFPLGAFVAHNRRGFRSASAVMGGLCLVFCAYLAFSQQDLKRISAKTPRSWCYSYGALVPKTYLTETGNIARLGTALGFHDPGIWDRRAAEAAGILGFLGAVSAVGLGVALARPRGGAKSEKSHVPMSLAGWGAFISAWMIGNNWVYRLIFLLLALPRLLEIARDARQAREDKWFATIAIGSILVILWIFALPMGRTVCQVAVVITSQVAGWCLCALGGKYIVEGICIGKGWEWFWRLQRRVRLGTPWSAAVPITEGRVQ